MRWTVLPWRRAVAAAALVPLLAVGGCVADEPEDVPTTSVSTSSPTHTPSPSPTADLTTLPERPAAMEQPTTDGAIAAATYVLELYGYTFATADAAPWRSITLDTCEFCTGVETAVTEMVEAGRTSSGSSVTVVSAKATEISDDRWFSVDMEIVQSASERYDSEGNVVGRGVGGPHRAVFALSWSEGWRVDEMGVEPIEADAS